MKFGLMEELLTLHGQSETMVKLDDIYLRGICQVIMIKPKARQAGTVVAATKVCNSCVWNGPCTILMLMRRGQRSPNSF